jgi:D-beta-D-heptose 7-phosphate kinase/D-beta-D-heptose 1-phosphate adenosyltransferase
MGKKAVTVAVSGAFDPIHAGHIRYISEAAKLGNRLVVILNGDDFLLKKKGFVFWPFAERKEIMEHIKGVDQVIAAVDKDQTVCKTLELLKPDIFAKGGDRSGPDSIPEVGTCHKIGCKVITNVGGTKIRSDIEPPSTAREPGAGHTRSLRISCPYCDDHPVLREKCLYCGRTGKIEVGKAD